MGTKLDLTDIMIAAIDAEVGIAITTNDPEALKRRFYASRREYKEQGIPRFDDLTFVVSPNSPTNEAWLFKKDAKARARNASELEKVEDGSE